MELDMTVPVDAVGASLSAKTTRLVVEEIKFHAQEYFEATVKLSDGRKIDIVGLYASHMSKWRLRGQVVEDGLTAPPFDMGDITGDKPLSATRIASIALRKIALADGGD